MEMRISLQPMRIPNFVLSKMPARPRQEGFKEGPKWALSELYPEVLSDLCDNFRAGVFEKAGKPDPKI